MSPSRRPSSRSRSDASRWLPAVAAAALLGTVVVAGVAGGSGDGSSSDAGATTTVLASPVSQPPPVVTVPTSEPTVKTRLDRTLSDGVAGEDVKAVQARLVELGFDPGPVDGVYGLQTIQAVWAFEKLVMQVPREAATGRVTDEMWSRMQDPIKISPRRPTNGQANHTEIYLPEQVIAVFHADEPVLVSHMSSGELDENGDPAEWCELVTIDTDDQGRPLEEPIEKDICGISKTPGGVFEYYRRVEGIRNGALGSMWNPVYFNYGIAVHGALNVPLSPASHGCVRIPMHISEYFQDLVANGDRVLVWNGEEEPEEVSERDSLPVFDYPNPNSTTTTSTSTTTTTTSTTTTTVAPATTQPVATPPPTTRPPQAATVTTTTVAPDVGG